MVRTMDRGYRVIITASSAVGISLWSLLLGIPGVIVVAVATIAATASWLLSRSELAETEATATEPYAVRSFVQPYR
jgi:hypothetical protein